MKGFTGIKLVLFDLDGTLADTAPDLAHALNKARAEADLPPLPYEQIRAHVSHGAMALTQIGFDITPQHDQFEFHRQRLLHHYANNLTRQTRLFPGMAELLMQLKQHDVLWGVVTNKPKRFTDPLLNALQLTDEAACIVSGDTTTERKPHPLPILYACEQANCHASACLYVGDAERDIEAGRRAGTRTLTALFGYYRETDQPQTWGADGMINHAMEILDWIA